MIVDTDIFREQWVPRRLQHREGAVDVLSHALAPGLGRRVGDDVLIAGPSGVGKTVLSRHCLRIVGESRHLPNAHLRSLGMSTATMLRECIEQHPSGANAVPANRSIEELRDRLQEAVGDGPFTVIVDEADDVDTDGLEALIDTPNLSIVVICHDEDRWLANVPDGVRRRIARTITLDRYGVDELADILEARANLGLRTDAITRQQLERIADGAAGVARMGIKALESAAEIATERGHYPIADEDVEDSFERARRKVRRANLRSLLMHHHVLYELIRLAGEISGRELHDRYDAVSEDVYQGFAPTPISRRARRNKLAKLREYDLIEVEGSGIDRMYRVCDETIESPLSVDVRDPAEQ